MVSKDENRWKKNHFNLFLREQVENNHPIKFENSDFFRRNFNLTDYSDCPFNKTNNEINYIHKQTNHRPSFIKQLPLSVETRLSKLFSNEKATLSQYNDKH